MQNVNVPVNKRGHEATKGGRGEKSPGKEWIGFSHFWSVWWTNNLCSVIFNTLFIIIYIFIETNLFN